MKVHVEMTVAEMARIDALVKTIKAAGCYNGSSDKPFTEEQADAASAAVEDLADTLKPLMPYIGKAIRHCFFDYGPCAHASDSGFDMAPMVRWLKKSVVVRPNNRKANP
jgi:hypothetical protein